MGKAYDDAYSGWLYRNGFSERKDLPENERPPLLKEKERTFLLRCMTHLDEITAWRCGLTDYQRRSWNHPRTVWEHFEKDMQPAPDADLSNIEENPEDFEDAKKEVEKKTNKKPREDKLSEAERAAEIAEAHFAALLADKDAEINDLKATINDLKSRILELREIVLTVGGKLPPA